MEAWACAACGDDNAVGLPFCGGCGARDEVERAVWGCRGCGQPNAGATAFCGRCGQRRGESRPEDLRLVTSLFADISGFTTLADQLDAEDLHAVINPLIAGLAGIAERYDGFVAKYAGDALLCLFGAPTQHEDDAQRALLAALEMQAQLPSLLGSLGPVAAGLTIHVGVNTGRVVAGAVGSAAQNDYSVLGDSVILAQRLESVCPSGQTYVGESTYELCQDEFDFEDVGELQLKGKLSVVRGYRLVGRRRAGTDASRPLVGRDAELAELVSTVQRSGVAVLAGEPGVGKSRVLAEARLRATAAGMRWLPMRCLSYGAGLPYWPFVDLLRQALGLRVEDPVEDVLARLSSSLPPPLVAGAARLLGRPVDDLEPEAARRQVRDALAGMLRVLSGGRPVVLAVEDVHWIDSASAEALAELVRTPGGVPLGVALSCRPEGLEQARALAADAALSTEVVLEPLGAAAVPLVAAGVLGRAVAPGLCGLLVARSRGNPLFVEELARSLREDAALVETSAGLDLRPGFDVAALPDTVERVFAARVDSLPLPAAAVLLMAAVVGRVIRLSLLEAVARDEGVDLAPLDDLVALGLLDRVVEQDEPGVTFHHALLHDAVYGRLLKKQRRLLHRRVADVGRALYGDGDETIDLLARHLYLAEAGEEAVDALLRAGRRAARLYANDAAAEHLARAVELLEPPGDDPRRLTDVLLELGTIEEIRGAYDAALARFSHARTLSGGLRACLGQAAVLRGTGRFAEALDVLAGWGGEGSAQLLLERARNCYRLGDTDDAVQAAEHALELATGRSEHDQVEALLELASITVASGRPAEAAGSARAALLLLGDNGFLRQRTKGHRLLGHACNRLGQPAEARRELQRAVQLAEQVGDVAEVAGTLLNLALVLQQDGDLEGAVAATQDAAQRFERVGHGSGRAICYCNLADMLLAQGEPDQARTWAARSFDVADRLGLQQQAAVAQLTLAEIELAAGDPPRCLALLEVAREVFLRLDVVDMAAYCDDVATQAQQRVALAVR